MKIQSWARVMIGSFIITKKLQSGATSARRRASTDSNARQKLCGPKEKLQSSLTVWIVVWEDVMFTFFQMVNIVGRGWNLEPTLMNQFVYLRMLSMLCVCEKPDQFYVSGAFCSAISRIFRHWCEGLALRSKDFLALVHHHVSFFPNSVMGSSAQFGSGVRQCSGRFRRVPQGSGVCWCRFRRHVLEGFGRCWRIPESSGVGGGGRCRKVWRVLPAYERTMHPCPNLKLRKPMYMILVCMGSCCWGYHRSLFETYTDIWCKFEIVAEVIVKAICLGRELPSLTRDP